MIAVGRNDVVVERLVPDLGQLAGGEVDDADVERMAVGELGQDEARARHGLGGWAGSWGCACGLAAERRRRLAGRRCRCACAWAWAVIWAKDEPGRRMKAIRFPSPDQVGLESRSTDGARYETFRPASS